MKRMTFSTRALLALLLLLLPAAGWAGKAPTQNAGQASLTLTNCNSELCNANNTAWTLDKTPVSQSITLPADPPTITWTVTATRGATSHTMLSVFGVITITNTGSADATLGNVVINLQKKGLNTSSWVSVAADVADATNGDAATSANIVAAASSESATVNAAQGPPNYTVSGAKGTFTETAGSGALEFTDASSNTIFSLTPQVSLAPSASITLLYTATFDNTVLGLAPGTQVRAEAMVSFGNSGARGGSGSTANNIDVNGNGNIDADEANVRTVPCRVTRNVPELKEGNATVTMSDMASDVSASGTGIGFTNFTTDMGAANTGSGEAVSANTSRTVSVDATCVPPGSGTITNTAHLDGESCSVTVQGPQIGTDPVTGQPIYQLFQFPCVTGVALDASANVSVACELPPPPPKNFCTYSKGGYGGPGAPGQLFDNNYLSVFVSGLTIGIEDGTGPKHDASWTGDATGRSALKTYLTSSASGANTALTADTSNATSTSGGSLPRQTATLALNVGFGIELVSGTPVVDASGFGNLQLCNLAEGSVIGAWTLTAAQAAALNGTSVSGVLADANNALGGNGLPGYVGSFGDLNQLVTALDVSFDNCSASAFGNANLCQP
jgi:hypothetical protein